MFVGVLQESLLLQKCSLPVFSVVVVVVVLSGTAGKAEKLNNAPQGIQYKKNAEKHDEKYNSKNLLLLMILFFYRS
jgi:hypothetical protein